MLRKRDRFRARFPFQGFDQRRNEIPFVDGLSDADLNELNSLLHWNCFAVDRHGRRFGNATWEGKRSEPEAIPDPRIVQMHERLNLSGKHVLEIGCFEGAHTIGLCRFAGRVTAVDARIENVVKTLVRCGLFDVQATVFKCDVEDRPLDVERLSADLVHHVGVLYHLTDPVTHLADLSGWVREGLLLDTHVSSADEATLSYEAGGKSYRYRPYTEGGLGDAFSGMYDHAKWLVLEDLIDVLRQVGFERVEFLSETVGRHGARVTLIVQR